MNKLGSLAEAISLEIHDGMSVVMGCGLESLIPFSPWVSIEKIRQETGWPLGLSDDPHETEAPSPEELAAVRKYDLHGIWTS